MRAAVTRSDPVLLACHPRNPPTHLPGRRYTPREAGRILALMSDRVRDQAIRVLVADDRPAFHRELAESLAFDRRLEVVGHAHDEEETLDLLATFEPEIVVMNVSSPELGGSDAVSRIHAHRPATRILAVFDSSSTDAIFTLAGVRAAGYIATDDLPPAVARAVIRLAGV